MDIEARRERDRRQQAKKKHIYFPLDTLREITREAQRQGVSFSELIREAWQIARVEIKKRPRKQTECYY